MKFLHDDSSFDVEGFRSAVEVVFTAQEIIVGNADYPTEKITENSRRFRQLGIGYANIGALLMAQGLPYDSDQGRAWAGAITALMTGHAYATSARTAARMGPFAGYHENVEPMLNVLRMHRDAVAGIDEEAGADRAALRRPGGVGHGGGAGRAVRGAQLAGQRAGPHRHHRPADGLRHHRGRARPRSGQDQEAGRRRHHVHRQPDRAPGADPARATRPIRSTRSSPTSTSTSPSWARRTCRPSTCRCSPARWATTPSTISATCG